MMMDFFKESPGSAFFHSNCRSAAFFAFFSRCDGEGGLRAK
jgi:hypothetical protein